MLVPLELPVALVLLKLPILLVLLELPCWYRSRCLRHRYPLKLPVPLVPLEVLVPLIPLKLPTLSVQLEKSVLSMPLKLPVPLVRMDLTAPPVPFEWIMSLMPMELSTLSMPLGYSRHRCLWSYPRCRYRRSFLHCVCISKLQPEGVLCKHMRFVCFTDGAHLKHMYCSCFTLRSTCFNTCEKQN